MSTADGDRVEGSDALSFFQLLEGVLFAEDMVVLQANLPEVRARTQATLELLSGRLPKRTGVPEPAPAKPELHVIAESLDRSDALFRSVEVGPDIGACSDRAASRLAEVLRHCGRQMLSAGLPGPAVHVRRRLNLESVTSQAPRLDRLQQATQVLKGGASAIDAALLTCEPLRDVLRTMIATGTARRLSGTEEQHLVSMFYIETNAEAARHMSPSMRYAPSASKSALDQLVDRALIFSSTEKLPDKLNAALTRLGGKTALPSFMRRLEGVQLPMLAISFLSGTRGDGPNALLERAAFCRDHPDVVEIRKWLALLSDQLSLGTTHVSDTQREIDRTARAVATNLGVQAPPSFLRACVNASRTILGYATTAGTASDEELASVEEYLSYVWARRLPTTKIVSEWMLSLQAEPSIGAWLSNRLARVVK